MIQKTSRFLSETRVCWFYFVWNWLQHPSRRQNKKFFDPAIFQKCWRGVGEQPTFAEQIIFATSFSCCNCIFWNCPIQTKLNLENQDCKFEQGNGAIAARWQAKAGVEPPFAGRWRPFSLRRIALRKTNCVWFSRIASLSACVLLAGGCVVRIAYECFLDYSLLEVFLFSRWRTAFPCFF